VRQTNEQLAEALAALRMEREQELARLEEAAERWLDAKAGKSSTTAIEVEISAFDKATRKLERKIHDKEKKLWTQTSQ
jgi:hypothetical protein